ncbi:MAG: DUF1127 domain-containing protein [Zoogloeaceae bacterium]|nr:DUF1127 domain-containing protein [Zoogloeaceae bacterium]
MTIIALLQRALATLRLLRQRQSTRRQLRELDRHALRDIGVTREQALHEACKPFWRA